MFLSTGALRGPDNPIAEMLNGGTVRVRLHATLITGSYLEQARAANDVLGF